MLIDFFACRVAFDAMGDRMFAEYEVINVQDNQIHGLRRRTRNATVGSYKYLKVKHSYEIEAPPYRGKFCVTPSLTQKVLPSKIVLTPFLLDSSLEV